MRKKLFFKRKKGKKESIRRSGLRDKPKGNAINEGFCERVLCLWRSLLAARLYSCYSPIVPFGNR